MYRRKYVAEVLRNSDDTSERRADCNADSPFGLLISLSTHFTGSGWSQIASVKSLAFWWLLSACSPINTLPRKPSAYRL